MATIKETVAGMPTSDDKVQFLLDAVELLDAAVGGPVSAYLTDLETAAAEKDAAQRADAARTQEEINAARDAEVAAADQARVDAEAAAAEEAANAQASADAAAAAAEEPVNADVEVAPAETPVEETPTEEAPAEAPAE